MRILSTDGAAPGAGGAVLPPVEEEAQRRRENCGRGWCGVHGGVRCKRVVPRASEAALLSMKEETGGDSRIVAWDYVACTGACAVRTRTLV